MQTYYKITFLLLLITLPAPLLSAPPLLSPDREPIIAIKPETTLSEKKVALGKMLFNDPRLSANDTVSCAHCHAFDKGGSDALPVSVGINGSFAERNAPSVFNSSLQFAQFWDGRAATLEEQVDGPVLNPKEMGSSWPQIIAKLQKDKTYKTLFSHNYDDGITADNIRNAIAIFERSLVTPNGRFDRYLNGENDAITDEEAEGYQLFKSYGCTACHQGQGVGGNIYEKLGVVIPYFDNIRAPKKHDYGRYNITGEEHHRYYFKVPSLRNVALTAPYLHDGSIEILEEVVYLMGKHQLGRRIPKKDAKKIVAFLKTLTGTLEP